MSQPPWTSHPSGGRPLPPSGSAAPVRSPGVTVAAVLLIVACLLTLLLNAFTSLPWWLLGLAVIPLAFGVTSVVTSASNPAASRSYAVRGWWLLLGPSLGIGLLLGFYLFALLVSY